MRLGFLNVAARVRASMRLTSSLPKTARDAVMGVPSFAASSCAVCFLGSPFDSGIAVLVKTGPAKPDAHSRSRTQDASSCRGPGCALQI